MCRKLDVGLARSEAPTGDLAAVGSRLDLAFLHSESGRMRCEDVNDYREPRADAHVPVTIHTIVI